MSIYCVSDIHGCYNEFQNMLNLINFQEKDEMYILGDIIDRGPQSAEMLWFATEEAGENFHFLLGNHEDMMLAAAYNYYNRDTISLRMHDSWAYNYGQETLNQIRHFEKYYEGWEKKILDWIDCLPLYYDIMVEDKRFILVHAGLRSRVRWADDCCLEGKKFDISIENLPIPQDSQAMLWDRTSWIADRYEWPFDIVCGHTPTCSVRWDIISHELPFHQDEANGIAHFGMGSRKHCIDCGVNRGYKLGCLRLDDMKEFYIGSEQKIE